MLWDSNLSLSLVTSRLYRRLTLPPAFPFLPHVRCWVDSHVVLCFCRPTPSHNLLAERRALAVRHVELAQLSQSL